MAWTNTAEGKLNNPQYTVYSETLITKEVGSSVTGANWTSVIDFIPPGCDFQVIANTAATNLSASTHVELFYGYDRNAAVAYRYRSNLTPFKPVTAELDTATKTLSRDVSGREFPYYWLKVPSGGGSVTIKVIPGTTT